MSTLSIQKDFNILSFQSLANPEGLAEQVDVAMGCDLSEESDSSSGDWQCFVWNEIAGWQFAQFAAPTMLCRGQASQAWLDMLGIHSIFQALQFAFQGAHLGVVALKQAWLKPAVEVLDAAIVLRATGRDQQRFDPET
jgi:hypothetical protein